MAAKKRRHALFVIGMHRSGTSATARILSLGGARLGEDDSLAAAARDNETGFWEAKEIRRLNDEILDVLGGSWSAPPAPRAGWARDKAFAPLRTRAREAMTGLWGAAPSGKKQSRVGRLILAKDPRAAITLPFWQTLIQRLDAVVCLRNPLSVAQSIHARDELPLQHGLDLWFEYTLAALLNTEDSRRVLVHYEDLMTDWTRPYAQIRAVLGADGLATADEIVEDVEAFLRPELQHQHTTEAELLGSSEAGYAILSFYHALRAASRQDAGHSGTSEGERESKDAIQALARAAAAEYFDANRRVLEWTPANREAGHTAEDDASRLRTLVASERQRSKQIHAELSRSLVATRSRHEQSLSALESLRAEANVLRRANQTFSDQLAFLEHQLSESRSRIEAVRSSAEAERHEITARLGVTHERIEVLEGDLLVARNERDLAESARLESRRELDRARYELETAQSDNASLLEQIEAERELVAATEQQRNALNETRLRLEARVASMNLQIETSRDHSIEMRKRYEDQLAGYRAQLELERREWQALFDDSQERHHRDLDAHIHRISSEYESQVERFRASADDLSARAAALEVQLEERGRHITALYATQKLREVEAEQAKRDLHSLAEAHSALLEEAAETDEERLRLRGTTAELEIELAALRLDHRSIVDRFEKLSVEATRNRERYASLRGLVRESIWLTSQRFVGALPGPVAGGIKSAFYAVYGRLAPKSERFRVYRQSLEVNARRPSAEPGPVDYSAFLAPKRQGPRDFDVLIFSVIDWHFRHQRPQHIALELARLGHRVFYIATTFHDDPTQYRADPDFVAPGVTVIKLPCPTPHPVIYRDAPSKEQVEMMLDGLDRVRERYSMSSTVSIVNHPFWTPIVQAIPASRTVYDCMDHHAGFENTGSAVLSLEDRLMRESSLVVCTAELLEERARPLARRVLRLPNAGEFEHFSARVEAPLIDRERPVVGYFGAIAGWFDVNLVATAAREMPDADFVLIGSTFGADLEALDGLANVEQLGEIPYAELPRYLSGFDVCLIPFQVNPLTLSTNPVKVFEYLSAGKPVVSVRLPELEPMSDVVLLSSTPDEFVSNIRLALTQRSDEWIKKRKAFARENSWQNRGALLGENLRSLFPRVSVIVLTYNQLEFTTACLDSLERFTDYPNWELIVVDNASSDGTPDYLREFAQDRPHVQVVLNDENLGFSAGNNRGAEVASGDYLAFLNNDTYVTEGWITDLLAHFEAVPDLGLLGPVTNNIGNEAKIAIDYADMAEMAKAAGQLKRLHRHERRELQSAAFFCVLIPTPLWREVGGLDEGFEVGFFEDDDYANRVRRAGYRVMCAEDTFVHHHLSASFNALDAARRKEIFETNKSYYESKWGPWIPHRMRSDKKN